MFNAWFKEDATPEMLTTITLKKGDVSGVKLPELGGARPNGCYKLTNFDAVTIDAKLHFQVENAEEAAQLSKAMGGSMLAKFKPRVEVDYDELASSGKAKVTALPQPEPNAEAKAKGKKEVKNTTVRQAPKATWIGQQALLSQHQMSFRRRTRTPR